jgi:hypothetical protein
MRRLCTESSCPYPGRSARQAACAATGVGLRPTSKEVESPPNPTVVVVATGAGLRPRSKGLATPPGPTATQAARAAVTPGVMGQKSADGIVAQRPP